MEDVDGPIEKLTDLEQSVSLTKPTQEQTEDSKPTE
jgi:hypothetical protein